MLVAVELYTRRGWVIVLTTLFGFIILVGAGLLGSETALGVIFIGAGLLFGAGPVRELVAPRSRLVLDDAGIRARATKLDLSWGEIVDAGYEDRTEANAAARFLVLRVHDASPVPLGARRGAEPNKAFIKIDHLDRDDDTLMAEVQRRIGSVTVATGPRARV
jgi:hypothetical protein